MTRTLWRRLERLERQSPSRAKLHVVLGASNEEVDAKLAALKASPDWQEGDPMLVVRFVEPVGVTA